MDVFSGKGLTVTMSYSEPLLKTGGTSLGAPVLLAGPYCEGMVGTGTGAVVAPGVTRIGLVALGLLLATSALAAMGRRRAAAKA
jgi:hypothetical protein